MSSSYESLIALKSELASHDTECRRAAIRQIAQDGSNPFGITAAVILLVADADEETRGWACEALESVIVPAPDEVSGLIELLRDKSDGEIEYWSATMLGRLGAIAGAATPVLANCMLDSRCLAARERAAWALSEIGPPARSAMNALRQIGPEDPPRLQRLAATAIQSVVARAA